MDLLDFFSREAGQRRRQSLEDGITYFVPPELRGLLGLAADVQPIRGMERAGQGAERVVNTSGWDRVQAIGDTLSEMAGVAAPVAAAKAIGMPAVRAVQEGLLGLSATPEAAAVRDFMVDDFGGMKLWHGSPRGGLTELVPGPDGTGALGPGVYGSPFKNTAERYTRDGGAVYEFDAPDDLFLGAGRQWDGIGSDVSPFQVWRDQVDRLVKANPDQEALIRQASERSSGDGYAFFRNLSSGMGSKEAAQGLYKRAGFKGLTAMVDGPEAVIFDRVGLLSTPTDPAIQRAANPATLGFRAFHGSPHDFDRFDMSKIGTGEGAQAYGHGLYFAENEAVARGYRDALSDPDAVPLQFDGRPVNTPWNDEIRERWSDYFSGLNEDDADAMEELLGNLSQVNNLADVRNVLNGVSNRAKVLYSRIVKPKLVKPDVGPGRMYEVQINADPNDFLDWDKPLSEQPQNVRDWFDSRGITPGFAGNQSGAELMMAERSLLGPEGAMVAMRDANIPGIKYFDHGSRFNAMDGIAPQTQTRNFVVFDDRLIDIVRKYGIAGAAALYGVSAMDIEAAMAGERQPQGLLGD